MANNIELVITNAGLAEITNAEKNGTAPVILKTAGFGTGIYTATATQTALVSELKRVNSVAGGTVGENIIHIEVSDNSGDEYSAHEIGIYTESGTLFAVYSSETPIFNKAAAVSVLFSVDIAISAIRPESVSFGEISLALALATTENEGIVELATNEEAIAGTDFSRVISPATLAAAFVKQHSTSGFQKLPNGLIIQWGTALIANGTTGTAIVFPTAFPNACRNVSCVATGTVPIAYVLASTSKTGATLRHNGNGGVQTFWQAIGY